MDILKFKRDQYDANNNNNIVQNNALPYNVSLYNVSLYNEIFLLTTTLFIVLYSDYGFIELFVVSMFIILDFHNQLFIINHIFINEKSVKVQWPPYFQSKCDDCKTTNALARYNCIV